MSTNGEDRSYLTQPVTKGELLVLLGPIRGVIGEIISTLVPLGASVAIIDPERSLERGREAFDRLRAVFDKLEILDEKLSNAIDGKSHTDGEDGKSEPVNE